MDKRSFWVRDHERFVEVMDAKPVEGFDFDLFVHKTVEGIGYTVTEGKTGLAVFPRQIKRKDAITQAQECVQRRGRESMAKCIECCIEHSGLSPRYGGIVEAGLIVDPVVELAVNYQKRFDTFRSQFAQIFGVQLSNFWSKLTGFDVVRFDEQVIQSGDGRMSTVVEQRYGPAAVLLVRSLLR